MKSMRSVALVFTLGVLAACGDARPPAAGGPISAEEQSVRTMERGLAPMLSRSSEGLHAQALSGGGERLDLQGRFQSAAVAKIGPDGKLSTDCVDSLEDADAFLRAAAAKPQPAGASDR